MGRRRDPSAAYERPLCTCPPDPSLCGHTHDCRRWPENYGSDYAFNPSAGDYVKHECQRVHQLQCNACGLNERAALR